MSDQFDEDLIAALVKVAEVLGNSYCLQPGDLEDIVQEAALTALKRKHLFDPSRGTMGGWLFWIGRSLVLRQRMTREKKKEHITNWDFDR